VQRGTPYNNDMSTPSYQERIAQAIQLIARTPGHDDVAADLTRRFEAGRIRFKPSMIDRGEATLSGNILLGPEAIEGSMLGLAETLVHEHYHLHQPPILKSVSLWMGVFTRTPLMRRYERPAYEAALRFLVTVARTYPELAEEAEQEADAIGINFSSEYGGAPLA
jgi:hypothetical protein